MFVSVPVDNFVELGPALQSLEMGRQNSYNGFTLSLSLFLSSTTEQMEGGNIYHSAVFLMIILRIFFHSRIFCPL
jgi:hypothetical protein